MTRPPIPRARPRDWGDAVICAFTLGMFASVVWLALIDLLTRYLGGEL